MVIKSSFKDYYDWVANKYGGGDPRVVYVRGRLSPLPKPGEFEKPLIVEIPSIQPLVSIHHRYWSFYKKHEMNWMYLVIAGKPYLISKPASDLSEDVNSYKLEPLVDPEDEQRPSWYRYRPKGVEFGKEYPNLIRLSQLVGHPVFAIKEVEHGWQSQPAKVTIAGQCPILQNIGLPSLISTEQMYQDLSYFVGNLMKASPDVKPPVELSNRQKIIKAGFDLVQSFRHRK